MIYASYSEGLLESPLNGRGSSRRTEDTVRRAGRARGTPARRSRYARRMSALTHHSGPRAAGKHHQGHRAPGQSPSQAMHPDRAQVASHLHRLHKQVTAPGMEGHPLTPSEGQMLSEGATQLQRAANTVTG